MILSLSAGSLTFDLISNPPPAPGYGSHGVPLNPSIPSFLHRPPSSGFLLKPRAFTTPSALPMADSPLSKLIPNYTPSIHLTSNLFFPMDAAGEYITHSPSPATGLVNCFPLRLLCGANSSSSYFSWLITVAADDRLQLAY